RRLFESPRGEGVHEPHERAGALDVGRLIGHADLERAVLRMRTDVPVNRRVRVDDTRVAEAPDQPLPVGPRLESRRSAVPREQAEDLGAGRQQTRALTFE